MLIHRIVSHVGDRRIEIADKRTVSVTGIGQVFHSSFDYLTDAEFVARKAIDGFSRHTFENIVVVTQTPQYLCPSVASILHARLDLPQTCVAFDINHGCAGYVMGLYVAQSLRGRTLLIVGDHLSKLTSESDAATRCVFSDCVTATVLDYSSGDSHFEIQTFPQWQSISAGYGDVLRMDGTSVYAFSQKEVPTLVKERDVVFLHQANKAIVDGIISKAATEIMPRFPISYDRYGNASSASIPLTMCVNYNRFPSNTPYQMLGFGSGLTVASMMAEQDYPIYCELV